MAARRFGSIRRFAVRVAVGTGPRRQWFNEMWRIFADHLCTSRPGTEFYAEKTPVSMPHMVRESFPARTMYLIRDPRDIFISANAFMKKKDYYGFMRGPEDSDLDHARSVCASFVEYVTNYVADRDRDDCLLLRYEDLVGNTKEALAALEAATGLVLDAGAGAEHFASHGTAASLALTEARWRREALPKEAANFSKGARVQNWSVWDIRVRCLRARGPLRRRFWLGRSRSRHAGDFAR